MIARTSAKSRLMSPGIVMMSLMPWTPWRRTSSTTRNASRMLVFFWTTSLSRSLGIVMSVSTWALSSSAAFSATSLRLLPSKVNGLVTTPMVSAPDSFAIWATTGAAPDPVPPPSPAVMKTMSESASAVATFSESSSAERWPMRRIAAGAEAAGDLVADPDLVRRIGLQERLGVRIAGDELDAHHLGPDHPVDGVGTTAADADDADQREVLGIGTQRHRELLRGPVGGHGVSVGSRAGWAGSVGTRRTIVQAGSAGVHGSIAPSRQRRTSRSPARPCEAAVGGARGHHRRGRARRGARARRTWRKSARRTDRRPTDRCPTRRPPTDATDEARRSVRRSAVATTAGAADGPPSGDISTVQRLIQPLAARA